MRRPTWVEINLKALSNNLNNIKNKVGLEARIIAIVKANAYGHGMEEVSRRLSQEGVYMFGVATVEDAVKLRQSGIDNPILLLGCILPEQIETIVMNFVTPTIVNCSIAEKISSCGSGGIKGVTNEERKIKVHVKVDTGMGGIGIRPEDAPDTIKKIMGFKNIVVEGIFTHFACSDAVDRASVNEQLNLFKNVISKLESSDIHIPVKHTDNSGMIAQTPSPFNTIRPGIALYGLYSSRNVPRSIDLQQIMSFKTRIVNIKKLNKGETVSYGRTYKVNKETIVATLPVGYSDGYKRELSNKGNVLVKGRKAPVIGLVRMDFTYVDITNVPSVNVGDEVVLFGNQGNETISIESIAEDTNVIPYEVSCGIGKDVPRVYIQ